MASVGKTVVLITGGTHIFPGIPSHWLTLTPTQANSAIGYELAAQLLQKEKAHTTASLMHRVSVVPYRASKTALNMVTACQFVEYGALGIRVSLYDPGFTVSNLSANDRAENGARSAEESVRSLVELVEGKRDGEGLAFLHNTGSYPW